MRNYAFCWSTIISLLHGGGDAGVDHCRGRHVACFAHNHFFGKNFYDVVGAFFELFCGLLNHAFELRRHLTDNHLRELHEPPLRPSLAASLQMF